MDISNESSDPRENQILSSLPENEYLTLLPDMELVDLPEGQIISLQDSIIEDVYFPTSGLISLTLSSSDGDAVAVAMAGKQGMVGIPIILGMDTTPYLAKVEIAGKGMKMKASRLKRAFDENPELLRNLLRYTNLLLVQITQAAMCNQFHTVGQRLCKWLLVARDQIGSEEFQLTQEHLSQMMGSHRPNVTIAARALQKIGLIHYSRGNILILDQPGLEGEACECYGIVKERSDEFTSCLDIWGSQYQHEELRERL